MLSIRRYDKYLIGYEYICHRFLLLIKNDKKVLIKWPSLLSDFWFILPSTLFFLSTIKYTSYAKQHQYEWNPFAFIFCCVWQALWVAKCKCCRLIHEMGILYMTQGCTLFLGGRGSVLNSFIFLKSLYEPYMYSM